MKKIIPKDAVLIPPEAKRVFKGYMYDVYQWPQKMFDGSTETFEMLKRPDTVQIIAVKDNKIVMVDDEQPNRGAVVHFLGGRVDKDNESWLEAAKREMLEETGMSFKNWKLIAVYQPALKIEQFVPWFIATDFEDQSSQQLDNGEKIKIVFWDFEEVLAQVMKGHPTVAYAIPLFARHNSLTQLLDLPEFAGQTIER